MDKVTPRYKKEAAQEDMPKKAEVPPLKICQLGEGGRLLLPRDIRTQFLQDPVWGGEWRTIVAAFDQQWGQPIADAAPSPAPSGNGSTPGGSPPGSGLVAPKEEIVENLSAEFDWSKAFPGEPETLETLKTKYSELTEMTGGKGYNLILVTGPKLFVVATDALHIKASTGSVIAHGAGNWLLGDKAEKFNKEHPGKGIPCAWTNDLPLVVLLEDKGS